MNTKEFARRVSNLHEARTKKIRADLRAERYAKMGKKPKEGKDLPGFVSQLGSTQSVVEGLMPDIMEVFLEYVESGRPFRYKFHKYNCSNEDGCDCGLEMDENGEYIELASLRRFLTTL